MKAKERVLKLLQAHGHHATSFQILEEGFKYWFDPTCDAVVAYVEVSGWWVAAAAPTAPEALVGQVASRFIDAGRAASRKVAFFSVDEAFVVSLEAARGIKGFDKVKIGEQPEWNPASYGTEGRQRRTLRSQLSRARRKGVTVRRVSAREIEETPGSIRAQIDVVLDQWLETRRMSAMRFMVDLQPFLFPEHRRYYMAQWEGRAVGFLAAIPVYKRQGWFFEDIIRVPGAPNGTTELMIHTAMEDAAHSGDRYVTLGLCPLAGVDDEPGPHRVLRRGLKACYDHLGGLYQFPGLKNFKSRFCPDQWSPQFLVVSPPSMGVMAFGAVLRAFAGGGLVSFGLDTVLRLLARVPLKAWSWALVAFAVLLVPWTMLLAMADGVRWFGDVSIQQAWVTFDAAMVVALGALAWVVRKGTPLGRLLAIFLAGATLTDFLLTTVQAMHLHQEASGWAMAFIAAGMAGPLLATVFLGTLAACAPFKARPRRKRP